MPDRIAVKRLTKSDITIFARHYRAQKAAGDTTAQKSINLNREVFVDRLYPHLPELDGADGMVGEHRFEVVVYGPGAGRRLPAAVMIKKSQKNWRLNGFVRDPEDDPERFAGLEPGDLVVMDFFGDEVPRSGRLCFVHRADPLFGHFVRLLGDRVMAAFDRQTIGYILDAADIPAEHPMRDLALDVAGLHREMVRRLEELERAMAALPPPLPGLGHNHPPEPIEEDALSPEEQVAISEAVAVLRDEPPEADKPPQAVVDATGTLKSLGGKVAAYIAAKGDVFLNEAAKNAGAEVGKWAVRLPAWGVIGKALMAAAAAASMWLQATGHLL